MLLKTFSRHKQTILYGLSMAALLVLLRWLQLRFIILEHAFELYAAAIAIIFTALGIWLALRLTKPKVRTVIVEKPVFVEKEVPVSPPFQTNEKALTQLGISKRELEVLQLIAEGYSNQEIADRLFVSLNTVKTHSSNLFGKLDVKRRIQAIEKAKQLNIIQ